MSNDLYSFKTEGQPYWHSVGQEFTLTRCSVRAAVATSGLGLSLMLLYRLFPVMGLLPSICRDRRRWGSSTLSRTEAGRLVCAIKGNTCQNGWCVYLFCFLSGFLEVLRPTSGLWVPNQVLFAFSFLTILLGRIGCQVHFNILHFLFWSVSAAIVPGWACAE